MISGTDIFTVIIYTTFTVSKFTDILNYFTLMNVPIYATYKLYPDFFKFH